MKSEKRKIHQLFLKLCAVKMQNFPRRGHTKGIGVPTEQGVYIIYDKRKNVVHVGRTQRAKKGLRQRIDNYLLGQSSFVISYLKRKREKLRRGYTFKYLVVNNARTRALLESLAAGKLCPKHVGLGE